MPSLRIAPLAGALAALAGGPAQAHPGMFDSGFSGWLAGFEHPLAGWDHLIAMVAVGLWAAQQNGRVVWLVPATFLASMALGGVAGALAVPVGGVELMVALSVPIFVLLVIRRAHFDARIGFALVAFFACFHGFAHGQEMPGAASLPTFGTGFLLATALLHGTGVAVARFAMLAAAMSAGSASAQQLVPVATAPAAGGRMSEIVVYGRQHSLLGIADSATQGTVGATELKQRPLLRAGEVLETVPGIIVTQHAGGGKANQYFLRGFNLDHGTDFATSLDGMPLNLPTHGHGQGYTDLNPLIPELASRVNYEKGVYDSKVGDFSSAGAVDIVSATALPQDLARLESGMYGHWRGMAAVARAVGPGTLLAGGELLHQDGPWRRPDNFRKQNAQVGFSAGDAGQGYGVIGRGYRGLWESSDQVADSAVQGGTVPYFGALDDSTGGKSQRYSLQAEWHRSDADRATRLMAYGFRYTLNLFSNFTYFLTDPVKGDQFEQVDRRWTAGAQLRHTEYGNWAGHAVETSGGVQFRHDRISNGLFNTERRVRTAKEAGDGTVLPATARTDRIGQYNIGLWLENRIQWSDHLRTVAGLRGDLYGFDVTSGRPENSGKGLAGLPSPKLSIVMGPWSGTELYLQGGLGFHSNDARGAVTRVDPITGGATDGDGKPIRPADPLVRTYGAEAGIRSTAIDGLQTTLSLWWLDVDSELLFVGDAGTTEPSRPSRRAGLEFANYYTPTPWLSLDADLSLSRTRFRNPAPQGRHVPGSIESVIAAGITLHDLNGEDQRGPFGSLRLRYFGPRPLIEDNSARSAATMLVNAQVGYKLSAQWTLSVDIFNVLDRRDHDIDYLYESRITPAAAAAEERHFHPVEPRQVRVSLTARF